jgi:hypothetical protein
LRQRSNVIFERALRLEKQALGRAAIDEGIQTVGKRRFNDRRKPRNRLEGQTPKIHSTVEAKTPKSSQLMKEYRKIEVMDSRRMRSRRDSKVGSQRFGQQWKQDMAIV